MKNIFSSYKQILGQFFFFAGICVFFILPMKARAAPAQVEHKGAILVESTTENFIATGTTANGGWRRSGDTAPIPSNAVITEIGYGSDEHDYLMVVNLGRFVQRGGGAWGVEPASVPNISAQSGSDFHGIEVRLNSPPQPDTYMTRWAWDSSHTSGGTPTSDTSPQQECVHAMYQTFDLNHNLSGTDMESGNCRARGYNLATDIRAKVHAPPGTFITGIQRFRFGHDAELRGAGMYARKTTSFSKDANYISDTLPNPNDQQLQINTSLNGQNVQMRNSGSVWWPSYQTVQGSLVTNCPVSGGVVNYDPGPNTADCTEDKDVFSDQYKLRRLDHEPLEIVQDGQVVTDLRNQVHIKITHHSELVSTRECEEVDSQPISILFSSKKQETQGRLARIWNLVTSWFKAPKAHAEQQCTTHFEWYDNASATGYSYVLAGDSTVFPFSLKAGNSSGLFNLKFQMVEISSGQTFGDLVTVPVKVAAPAPVFNLKVEPFDFPPISQGDSAIFDVISTCSNFAGPITGLFAANLPQGALPRFYNQSDNSTVTSMGCNTSIKLQISTSCDTAASAMPVALMVSGKGTGNTQKNADNSVNITIKPGKCLTALALAPPNAIIKINGSPSQQAYAVTALYADSSTADVTSLSNFTAQPNGIVSLNGNIATALAIGDVTIGATYSENGISKSANTILHVQSNVCQVEFASNNPMALNVGQTLRLNGYNLSSPLAKKFSTLSTDPVPVWSVTGALQIVSFGKDYVMVKGITPTDGVSYFGTVTASQVTAGDGTRDCSVSASLDVKDFTLSKPADLVVEKGNPARFNLSLNQIKGFNSDVTLSTSGIPNSGIFSPQHGVVPFDTVLEFDTNILSVGEYFITVRAAETLNPAEHFHEVNFKLTIIPPITSIPPSASISISPAVQTITRGDAFTYSISSTCTNFAGPITGLALLEEAQLSAQRVYLNFSTNTLPCNSTVFLTIITNSTSDLMSNRQLTVSGHASGLNPDTLSANTLLSIVNFPLTVTTAVGNACGKLSISWSQVAGANTYNLYRATSNNFTLAAKIATFAGNITSYTDPALAFTEHYFYWVDINGGNLTPADQNSSGGIKPSPCPSITILASPNFITADQGTPSVFDVSAVCTNFTGPITNLAVNNLHMGANATFAAPSLACNGSIVKLVITSSAQTETGTKVLQITGAAVGVLPENIYPAKPSLTIVATGGLQSPAVTLTAENPPVSFWFPKLLKQAQAGNTLTVSQGKIVNLRWNSSNTSGSLPCYPNPNTWSQDAWKTTTSLGPLANPRLFTLPSAGVIPTQALAQGTYTYSVACDGETASAFDSVTVNVISSGGGGSANVDAVAGCDKVTLSWSGIPGNSFSIFRSASNNPITASLITSTATGTSYMDSNTFYNTPFYYWVAGSDNIKVPANSNNSGIKPSNCGNGSGKDFSLTIIPGAGVISPGIAREATGTYTVYALQSDCAGGFNGPISLSTTAAPPNSEVKFTDPNNQNIAKNQLDTCGFGSRVTLRITPASNTPLGSSPVTVLGKVLSLNLQHDASSVMNVISDPNVPPNLSTSDKDVTFVNSSEIGPVNTCNGSTDKIIKIHPSTDDRDQLVHVGDLVTFRINICNTGQKPVVLNDISDTFINLTAPSAGWGQATLSDGTTVPIQQNGANGIIFKTSGKVVPGSSGQTSVLSITYKAVTKVPPGTNFGLTRFQNVANITGSYKVGAISHPVSVVVDTLYQLLGYGPGNPNGSEVAP